eukprot:7969818-Alexandrium_andersonii.AAC.1
MLPATPPLEALQLLFSELATRQRAGDSRRHSGQRKPVMVDERKAHLHAFVDEEVYIALPPEVAEPG